MEKMLVQKQRDSQKSSWNIEQEGLMIGVLKDQSSHHFSPLYSSTFPIQCCRRASFNAFLLIKAKVLPRVCFAGVSLSKTLNPCQIQKCRSAAELSFSLLPVEQKKTIEINTVSLHFFMRNV